MKSLAEKIILTLENNGYEAYFIGGSVRNQLHYLKHNDKIKIKDYDIVTNASCEEVMELFNDTESRGVQFNVAVVRLEGYEFEIAQYRGETYPEGGSLRPNNVFPVKSLEEDLKRRDFTINGIAMTRDNQIIDPLDGCTDIREKKIRAIGNPNERFAEDPLRMIRAFRFMSQLDYHLDTQTKQGIKKNLHLLNKVPHERMKEEVHKMLRGKSVINALTEMRVMNLHKQMFYNSITEKQVPLLNGVLDLPKDAFKKMLFKLSSENREDASITDIYYIMYYYAGYDKAEKELRNTMFLNDKEIDKVLMLLKHNTLLFIQTSLGIYRLVRDIGEQRGLTYLKEILETYKKFHEIDFNKLDEILKRPLFKYQLPFNGNDIMEIGRCKFDLKPGKWVGDVLDKIQMYSIFGESYDLESIIEGFVMNGGKNKNNY